MNASLSLLPAALAAFVGACSRADLSGPPELRLGRDECGECGMIISEDRCSSAVLVEVGGRPEHVLFDDIGCMLAYSAAHPDTPQLGCFVHDYESGAWVPARDASFLVATGDAVSTPMASGIVAFSAPGNAHARQRTAGGQVVDHAGLAEAARARRPSPPAPPAPPAPEDP